MNLHDVPPSCTNVTFFAGIYIYIRACASLTYTCIYARACVCAARLGSASMWAEIPCSGRCWTIFPWPPRDTKLGMIIPYLPTEGRAVSSCRSASSFDSTLRSGLDDTHLLTQHFPISSDNARLFAILMFDNCVEIMRLADQDIFNFMQRQTGLTILQASYRHRLRVATIFFPGFESLTYVFI